eukprot:COSAG02_NODE_524_length_20723_cov_79.399438_3_plen_52_part_00
MRQCMHEAMHEACTRLVESTAGRPDPDCCIIDHTYCSRTAQVEVLYLKCTR